jgi:hypothetical protein
LGRTDSDGGSYICFVHILFGDSMINKTIHKKLQSLSSNLQMTGDLVYAISQCDCRSLTDILLASEWLAEDSIAMSRIANNITRKQIKELS